MLRCRCGEMLSENEIVPFIHRTESGLKQGFKHHDCPHETHTTGYTCDEQEIANKINEVWQLFNKLPQTHPSDIQEFHYGIHLLQQKMGMRILRRDYPLYWGPDEKK